jgi:hypothetical protein
MKKILVKLGALFLLGMGVGILSAQTTTVSATVVDSSTTTWANGSWSVQFVPSPSNPNINVYLVNGVPINQSLLNFKGSLDGSGNFSQVLYDNSRITPSGSSWKFNICPNSSAPCGSQNVAVSGSSLNLSATITAFIPVPSFPAIYGSYGYNDSEVVLTNVPGQLYYNVTSNCLRIYSGTSWACSTGTILGNPVPISEGGTGQVTAPAAILAIDGISSVDTSSQTMSGPLFVPEVNGIYDASTFGLIAALAACGSNSCAITVNQAVATNTVTIPTNVTLIFGRGGYFNIASGQTVTMNGSVLAPDDAFIFRGSGIAVFGNAISSPHVEWFGAVGDWNGTAGTENSPQINTCITALQSGQCMLLGRSYKITSPISITKSNIGIGGVASFITSPTLYNLPVSSSVLVVANSTSDGVDIAGVSPSNTVVYNKLTNFTVNRTVAPSSTARGVSVFYSYGLIIDGVTSQDSTADFYFHGVGSQGTGYIANSAATWGYQGFTESGLSMAGFEVDSVNGEPSPSFRLRHSFVANNPPNTGNTTYGLESDGAATNDLMVDGLETAQVSYGDFVHASSLAFTGSSDMHILNSINDGCLISCIYIQGVLGSLEVSGGWDYLAGTPSTPDIAIPGASNIIISNLQLYFPGSTAGGLVATGTSGSLSIIGNNFIGSGPMISFNETSGSKIIGNIMNGVNTTTAVSILNFSEGNLISANSIEGTATNGILIDSTSTGTTALDTNAVGVLPTLGTITNPIVNPSGPNHTVGSASCWKTTTQQGSCSTTPTGGTCTCN